MTATPKQAHPTASNEPPPRRNWLMLGLAAVLLIVAAGGVGWWIGSSGSDDASGAAAMPEVVEEFYDALIESDASAMAALLTEDGRFTGSQEGPTRSNYSPPQMREMVSAWFFYVDYTDVEHLDVIVEDDTVVVVSDLSGMSSTHEQSSKTPFSATVVDVFELRDGLIAQYDMYFDYNDVVT